MVCHDIKMIRLLYKGLSFFRSTVGSKPEKSELQQYVKKSLNRDLLAFFSGSWVQSGSIYLCVDPTVFLIASTVFITE